LESLAQCAQTPVAADALRKAAESIAVGNAAAARRLVDEAGQCEPQNPHIRHSAALAALSANQNDLAAELLMDPEYPISSASSYRLLGVAHYRRSDFTAAKTALGQAIVLDNSDALAYFLMGHTLRRMGDEQAADEHFERSRQLDPTLAPSR
jgi:Tfp pilus assembly protein PilF